MAEQIPYGVAVSLINKLASFAFREIGSVYGFSEELEKLKKTLESIKVVLSDAEQRQSEDPAIEHWICRFKQVLHDADDLLDGLAIKDLRRKVDGGSKYGSKVRDFFSLENPLVFRAKLAHKIEKIRKNFNDVAEDVSKLKLNPNSIILKQNESDWRETSSFVLQSDIIGREENKRDIIDLLKRNHTDQNVSLIAIVGIGGLGKTALAQLVYNDAKVQKLFQKYIWVCVSEDFEVKTVLKKMLKSLKKDEVGDLELDILQHKLQEELNGQKYMLVLDDVWNESQLKWNALRNYLMCGVEGSKILVTTRSKSVSHKMGINTPYVLEGLTKEQSWTLLKKVTFGENVSRMSPNLVSIGEKIAEKCRGVPLAVKTLGGLLQPKHEESEWMRILDGDFWRLCGEKESIVPVLKLSYQNLPLELQQCFAYCCLYPKDWEINSNELVQLWMAQGFLESSIEMQSMEDVGTQYVKILLMRSFFQDALMDNYGNIIIFKMHDLMHDLATSVAGNDCYLDSERKGIVGRPTHVSLLSASSVCSLNSLDARHLRSIICCNRNARLMTYPTFIENLKYLRVLQLSRTSITRLPEFIANFKCLKYLDLSYCNNLISLPNSIGNLVMLQTLKLNGCYQLVFCVKVITKLINLKHLDISGCKAFKKMMPAGLGKLTSLQKLSDFYVAEDNEKSKSGKLNELKELNNIGGELAISNLGLVKDVVSKSQEANLKAKKYIQCLKLNWGQERYLMIEEENKCSDSLQLLDNLCPHQNLKELIVEDYQGPRFLSWLYSLTNIVKIYLWNFSYCQHLPPLERLMCLKTLEIWHMKELKCMHYEEISNMFFPSLETLVLSSCENLRGWQRLGDDNKANDDIFNSLSLPSFPCLSSLKINNCPNLSCMPAFPQLIDKLELQYSNMKPIMETCLVQLESSTFYPLSTLKHLQIGEVREVEAMTEEWMLNLKSLEHLSFLGASIISPLLQHLQHLPSELRELEIKFVHADKLDLWNNEGDSTQCQAPFHCLRSLQKLSFYVCHNLKTLPEQIGDIQSLRHIQIYNCPKLESLPEAMRRLTNLQTLRVIGCPLLRDRCQAETGQEWPKIAHIQNKYISKY